jgi:hypothetical protein
VKSDPSCLTSSRSIVVDKVGRAENDDGSETPEGFARGKVANDGGGRDYRYSCLRPRNIFRNRDDRYMVDLMRLRW